MAMNTLAIQWDSPRTHAISVAELALQLTPQVTLSEMTVFLNFNSCERLYPTKAWLQITKQHFLRHGLSDFRFECGRNRSEALARMAYKGYATLDMPISALIYFVDPMNPLTHKSDKVLEQLKRLGIKKLADFMRLPIQQVAHRWGLSWLKVPDAINGQEILPWQYFRPPLQIQEEFIADEQDRWVDEAMVSKLTFSLIERAFERMRARQEAMLEAILQFYFTPHHLNFDILLKLPIPQMDSKVVMNIASLHLAKHFSAQACAQNSKSAVSLDRIAFQVTASQRHFSEQNDFLDSGPKICADWSMLLAELNLKYHNQRQCSFVATPKESYRPEGAFSKSPPDIILKYLKNMDSLKSDSEFNESMSCWFNNLGLRPTRLFKKPYPIDWSGKEFKWGKQLFRVVSVTASERLSGEWWGFDDFDRDYFCVRTQSHNFFWIFRDCLKHQYFIHGVF